jgi:hypothetical protein
MQPTAFAVKLKKSDTKYGSIVLRLADIGIALGQDPGKIYIINKTHVISFPAPDTFGLKGKTHARTHAHTRARAHTHTEERTKE